jgi:hypothetical protein
MAKSIQTHYLPRKAYLSFFETADPPGNLYMYQRNETPICLSTGKAARERDLYCFTDKDGNYNSDIEKMFERIESAAYPILCRLNAAEQDFDLTAAEWAQVSEFMAAQLVRTPGWLQKYARMYGEFAKAAMMKMASSDKTWGPLSAEAPDSPKVSKEGLRRFILSGEFDIESGGPYFLGLAIKAMEPSTRSVFIRDPILLRPRAGVFVASDHPIALMRHPKSLPIWGAGVINSNFLFPIGSHAALDLKVPFKRDLSIEREQVNVRIREIGQTQLNRLNSRTILNAERFVFASVCSRSIARSFSASKKPRRFRVDSPGPFIIVRSD